MADEIIKKLNAPDEGEETKSSKLPDCVLVQGDGFVPLQYGTNKLATQKGMTGFGRPRNIIDKVEAPNLKALSTEKANAVHEVVRLQSGSNKFDSQKGMSAIGAPRDVLYKPKGEGGVDELPDEKARMTEGVVPRQSGTNQFASQRGYRAFGTPRLNFTKELPDQDRETSGLLNPQMGTNKYASQAGWAGIGMYRSQVGKYTDEARGELPFDEGTLSKQRLGSSVGASKGASQSGMASFGTSRNNTMLISRGDRKSQGFIPFQCGVTWADSQAGKTAFGQPRNVITDYVDESRKPLPEELARDPNLPQWGVGYQYGASQSGMTCIGMPRDVKGFYLRRLW